MINKLSLLLTIVVVIGLVIALNNCGKKGALEPPPKDEQKTSLVAEPRAVATRADGLILRQTQDEAKDQSPHAELVEA